ncbi:MAG: hypothetical protein AAFQ66_04125 [Pseudomonadota bacterium]
MSFVREEVRVLFVRWQEVLAALALVLIGLFVATRGGFFLVGVGGVLLALGSLWAWVAYRRLAFLAKGDAPGLVEIDEGEITYLAPYGGAQMELDGISRVLIDPARACWILESNETAPLSIPLEAKGAATLFDALCSLPGFSAQTALQARSAKARVLVWERTPLTRLH